LPDVLFHAFATVWIFDVGGLAVEENGTRNDRAPMVQSQTGVTIGIRIARRVSALEFGWDDSMVRALQRGNYENAPISNKIVLMLILLFHDAADATRISHSDHERMRGVGFDDRGILQITLIASWF